MRSNPLYYINPSAISIVPNANGQANDLAVYIASGTKIKVYCPVIPALGYANNSFQEWELTGRNRRLNGGSGKYAIYARISRHETTSGNNSYKAYLIFTPYHELDGEWLEGHSHLTQEGLSEAYYMGGKNIEIDPNYWYVKLGEVSAIEGSERTVTLDTGILGTDAWGTQWEVDDAICSQYGTLDTSSDESNASGSENSSDQETDNESVETGGNVEGSSVIEVNGDNYNQEYELDGKKGRPSSFYNRSDPENGRFQPNLLLDRKTGEFMAARGKFHVHDDGSVEIHADSMEMTASQIDGIPSFRLHSANQDRSLVFDSTFSTSDEYAEWFGFAVPVALVDAGGQTVTGDILSLGVRRREDNTGWARLLLRNVERTADTPIAESATLLDNDSLAFYRDSRGWTPQTLDDSTAKLRIGIDKNGYPYIFSSTGSAPGGLPTENDLSDIPSGGLYVDANGFLKVKP